METMGIIALRKCSEDFALACKTLKDELANPDLAAGICEEIMTLGNQMDAQLDSLGDVVGPILKEAGVPHASVYMLEVDEDSAKGHVDQAEPAADAAVGETTNDQAEANEAGAEPDATGNDAPLATGFQSEIK